MVYVYILQSIKDNNFYIGITSNLKTRLLKHNSGGVFSTKSRRPFKIVHAELFETYKEARIREKEIKSY